MPTDTIVVVGGSMGSIGPLQKIVAALPSELPAALLVVTHLSPEFPSLLPQILDRAGALPACEAENGQPVTGGRIYVAQPDHHLALMDGVVHVFRGARENRHRPAIDPLFRTAARFYGSRVIAAILSGQLDDGAAGLRAVRSHGGVAIVQDPQEAIAGQMPSAALACAGADFVLAVDQIGPKIVELVRERSGAGAMAENQYEKSGEDRQDPNLTASTPTGGVGVPSAFACPDCGGVLWEMKDGDQFRFRCRVGHAFTIANLHGQQAQALENALWAAMRALEEKAALETRLADTMSDPKVRDRFREQAQDDRSHADSIRKMLFDPKEELFKKAA